MGSVESLEGRENSLIAQGFFDGSSEMRRIINEGGRFYGIPNKNFDAIHSGEGKKEYKAKFWLGLASVLEEEKNFASEEYAKEIDLIVQEIKRLVELSKQSSVTERIDTSELQERINKLLPQIALAA